MGGAAMAIWGRGKGPGGWRKTSSSRRLYAAGEVAGAPGSNVFTTARTCASLGSRGSPNDIWRGRRPGAIVIMSKFDSMSPARKITFFSARDLDDPIRGDERDNIGHINVRCDDPADRSTRSEEHTSEIHSLMRISYAVL